MQKHTVLLRSETAFGKDDARAPLEVRNRRGPGAREFGAALPELTMDHYHHEVHRDDFWGLFLFGERAGRGGTNTANRTKTNFHWIEYGDGDRSQLGLRCVVRVLEAALFYSLILTALASLELPCGQAQGFGGVHACGGQWSLHTGLKARPYVLCLRFLKLWYDSMARRR